VGGLERLDRAEVAPRHDHTAHDGVDLARVRGHERADRGVALGDPRAVVQQRRIRADGQFFLNVAMVFAKLALVCAGGVEGSSLVTVVARNGVQVGVKLSGTGERWFTGPAAAPDPAARAALGARRARARGVGAGADVRAAGVGGCAPVTSWPTGRCSVSPVSRSA
jgi:hypothetical protein